MSIGPPTTRRHVTPFVRVIAGVIMSMAALATGTAHAHGMGARYFAQQLKIHVAADEVLVDYQIEVPLSILQREFVDIVRADREAPLEDLKAEFRARKAEDLRRGIEIRLNGQRLRLAPDPTRPMELRPNDRVFMLYGYALKAPIGDADGSENVLEVTNTNYEGRDTLFSVEVTVADPFGVLQTGFEGDDKYFTDPRTNINWFPSNRYRSFSVRFWRVGEGAGASPVPPRGAEGAAVASGSLLGSARLAAYLGSGDLTLGVVVGALAVAFGLGVAHALAPGHGKTVVAAYLIGAKARLRDALVLGAAVTLTHSALALSLGLVNYFLLDRVLPEDVLPYLAAGSGVLVVVVGVWMLRGRVRASASGTGDAPACTAATEARDPRPPASLRDLASLGVSGGMVACPLALAVLLLGIGIGRQGFAIAMVLAFSVGLAVVLVGVGTVSVLVGRAVSDPVGLAPGPWARRLPMASAVVVILSGVAVVVSVVSTWGVSFASV